MNILSQAISRICLLATAFTLSTGCIIVIGPEDIEPPIQVPPTSVPGTPVCMTTAIDCDGTIEVIGEDEFGCAITECRPHELIYCQSDSDCENPNEACVQVDPECGLENESADEECIKACQAMPLQPEPIEPDLCDDVDCEDGYICIVERHQSPVTGEITERAACVEEEVTPIVTCWSDEDCGEGQICDFSDSGWCGNSSGICIAEEEEEEEEEERICYYDGDCDEDERCAFPGEEGFEEETNCMAADEGICVPRLL